MKEIIIGENEANQRIDRFLLKYMDLASKGFVEKMIRKKRVKVNHEKIAPYYSLKIQDKLQLYLAQETIEKFQQIRTYNNKVGKIDILYEDKDILIVNKQKNTLTHGGEDSLIDRGIQYLISQGKYRPEDEIIFTPACCNRLDRNTSGIVIIAKSYEGLRNINYKIKSKEVDKHYLTLVKGHVENEQTLLAYLKKDEGNNRVDIYDSYQEQSKKIETRVRPLKILGSYTLLDINLITGRSHQIRAHLKDIGHPVVGDPKYGEASVNRLFHNKFHLHSQFLHAGKVIIKNYSGKDLEVSAVLPEALQNIMKELS
ncbi:MAG: RluA family pseudouridine synthase [Eubacteriales bacterium]